MLFNFRVFKKTNKYKQIEELVVDQLELVRKEINKFPRKKVWSKKSRGQVTGYTCKLPKRKRQEGDINSPRDYCYQIQI
jgi:hypothetical protein